jgi:SAM-dependent methyltransferase
MAQCFGASRRGDDYDAAFAKRQRAGCDVHGEATFVASLHPRSVLDAGCGTGRVAIELARRGIAVLGVDLDLEMLAVARRKAPDLRWVHADLASVDVTRDGGFDVIVMAGNVMIFLAPGSEGAVVANLARHLAPGSALVAGFQLQPSRLDLATYDAHADGANLRLSERWATWDRDPFAPGGDYAVSVHLLRSPCAKRASP